MTNKMLARKNDFKNYRKMTALEKKYARLEPTKLPINKAKTEALTSVRAQWLPLKDALRQFDWRALRTEMDALISTYNISFAKF